MLIVCYFRNNVGSAVKKRLHPHTHTHVLILYRRFYTDTARCTSSGVAISGHLGLHRGPSAKRIIINF